MRSGIASAAGRYEGRLSAKVRSLKQLRCLWPVVSQSEHVEIRRPIMIMGLLKGLPNGKGKGEGAGEG